jgi:predicted transcriptional regulator
MDNETSSSQDSRTLLRLAAEIVAAFVSNNPVATGQIAGLIRQIHETLLALGEAETRSKDSPRPAVPVKRSVTPDYLICLEDGKKLKMLKRYLRSHYDMTPEDYRAKWNLPLDYPMVAPNYARQRSTFAKEIGLGLKSKGRKKR